jgi:hypothetical protein
MKRFFVSILGCFFLSASILATESGEGRLFPIHKGTVWTYEGTVYGTRGNRVHKQTAQWDMRVLDVWQEDGLAVALVTGFPGTFSLESQEPGRAKALIARDRGGRYYLIPEVPELDRIFETIPAAGAIREWLVADNLIWVPTPSVGDSFGKVPEYTGNDGRYCWRVMGWRAFDVRTVMNNPPHRTARRYILGFYTNPDHVIQDFVEGVGLVRYMYIHHGTVEQTYVKLVRVVLDAGV